MSAHFTINHEQEFITTENVHTQNIENLWSVFKRFLRKKSYNVGSKQNLAGYITEFMFKRMSPQSKILEFGKLIENFLDN